MKLIIDPLDPLLRERPIDQVLDGLCSQEGHDGEPYDQIAEAVDYIRELQAEVERLKRTIVQAAKLSYNISKRR